MFYSLATNLEFHLSFVRNDPLNKTADAYLNNFPTEIKTIVDRVQYQTRIERDLESEVLGSLKRNKIIQDLNDALSQNARIILLNATAASVGYSLGLYATTNHIELQLKDAIDNALSIVKTNSKTIVAVVPFATCVDFERKYRISSICVKCPIKTENGVPVVNLQGIN
jgi:predicted methyltransferase MtxX (methanogen marker protein 4)